MRIGAAAVSGAGVGRILLTAWAVLLVAASFAGSSQRAVATPLTLVSDGRNVDVFSPNCFPPCFSNGTVTPSTPFVPFDGGLSGPQASGSQNTTVGESAMGGSLAIGVTFGGSASSNFSITFDADVAATYALSSSGIGAGSGVMSASLLDVTSNLTLFQSSLFDFSDAGSLTAGKRYRLDVFVSGGGDIGSGNASFDFTATAVPEPSTAALLAAGLFALARRSRRRS